MVWDMCKKLRIARNLRLGSIFRRAHLPKRARNEVSAISSQTKQHSSTELILSRRLPPSTLPEIIMFSLSLYRNRRSTFFFGIKLIPVFIGKTFFTISTTIEDNPPPKKKDIICTTVSMCNGLLERKGAQISWC